MTCQLPTINGGVELEDLTVRIARSDNLPVLPQIVSSVLKLADDPHSSGRTIEQIIERDPAITAKVLKAANSPIYGGNKVPTIGRAMSVLGFNAIRSLVMNLAFQQMIGGRAYSTQFDKVNFWRHSLAVATASRILGKIILPIKSEELYLAGMMHDVGMLVMDRFCPDDLDSAIRYSREKQIPLHEAETHVIGFNHCAVGRILADKWQLPDLILDAIANHHVFDRLSPHWQTTSIVIEADSLAHQFAFTNNSPPGKYGYDPSIELELDIPEEQFEVVGKVMYEEVMRTQAAFQIC